MRLCVGLLLLTACGHHSHVKEPWGPTSPTSPAPHAAPPKPNGFGLAEACGELDAPACQVDGIDVAKVLLHPDAAVTERQKAAAASFAAADTVFADLALHPMPNLAVQLHDGDGSTDTLEMTPGKTTAFICLSVATDLTATLFGQGHAELKFVKVSHAGLAAVQTKLVPDDANAKAFIHFIALDDRRATPWVVCKVASDGYADEARRAQEPSPGDDTGGDPIDRALARADRELRADGYEVISSEDRAIAGGAMTFTYATKITDRRVQVICVAREGFHGTASSAGATGQFNTASFTGVYAERFWIDVDVNHATLSFSVVPGWGTPQRLACRAYKH